MFIIIATEYFTKWVEAVPLSATIGKHVSFFILNHIIFHYGIPSSIVTDNGGQFKNKDLRLLDNYANGSKSNNIGLLFIILKEMDKLKHQIKHF